MNETFLNRNTSFCGGFHRNGHRLMCGDGKIRAAELAPHPDTYFSVPAWVRVRGKRFSGYATVDQFTGVCSFRLHYDHLNDAPELRWDKTNKLDGIA